MQIRAKNNYLYMLSIYLLIFLKTLVVYICNVIKGFSAICCNFFRLLALFFLGDLIHINNLLY